MHKEVKAVVDEYVAIGCRLEAGRRHYKLYAPDGRFIRVIGKGSNNVGWELIRRMRSEVRRMREAAKR